MELWHLLQLRTKIGPVGADSAAAGAMCARLQVALHQEPGGQAGSLCEGQPLAQPEVSGLAGLPCIAAPQCLLASFALTLLARQAPLAKAGQVPTPSSSSPAPAPCPAASAGAPTGGGAWRTCGWSMKLSCWHAGPTSTAWRAPSPTQPSRRRRASARELKRETKREQPSAPAYDNHGMESCTVLRGRAGASHGAYFCRQGCHAELLWALKLLCKFE